MQRGDMASRCARRRANDMKWSLLYSAPGYVKPVCDTQISRQSKDCSTGQYRRLFTPSITLLAAPSAAQSCRRYACLYSLTVPAYGNGFNPPKKSRHQVGALVNTRSRWVAAYVLDNARMEEGAPLSQCPLDQGQQLLMRRGLYIYIYYLPIHTLYPKDPLQQ